MSAGLNAVGSVGFLLGFSAVLLTHSLLRRHFSPSVSLLTALLLWFATFLQVSMTEPPIRSNVAAATGVALVLVVWDRGRVARSPAGYALLGLLLGFVMCMRWQNGALLLLPAFELLRRAGREGMPWAKAGLFGVLLAVGVLVGVSPQMAAEKAPPIRRDHAEILDTLFSSRHGLLSWTPVLWAGFLGFLPLLKRKPALALPLLPPLVVMTFLTLSSGDEGAAGTFGDPRCSSLLPVLALGMAATIETVRRAVGRRPELAIAGLALPLVVWNGALMEEVRRGLVPRDDTVDGPRLVGHAAALVSDAVGFPTTWPASWVFAWRTGLSPGRYDRLVGRTLFDRKDHRDGRIEIAAADDAPMLGEGWGRVVASDDRPYRTTRGPARILLPLDVPEDLEVKVRAAGEGEVVAVSLRVNGSEAGRFLAGPEWAEHGLRVPSRFWRRELNDVVLTPESGSLRVDQVELTRLREQR